MTAAPRLSGEGRAAVGIARRIVPWVVAMAAIGIIGTMPRAATAQEDHSGLTRESFRQKCLLCHSRAAPEGISPAIMAGLHPEPGLRPADAMPGITCWRRCIHCWGPTPPSRR